ncbi:MAG: response regulator [Steroidobacteraceae bacterium]|jgi:CheY-like chemotaxis protein
MPGDSAPQILHVDDEKSVRDALAMLLRAHGYVVTSAASGPEALELAREGSKPDVLIVDFGLDDEMNGAEVAEKIRQMLRYTPPVVLLTGDLSNAEVPCVTDVPVWLMRKPANPDILLTALPALVQLSHAMRELMARNFPHSPQTLSSIP